MHFTRLHWQKWQDCKTWKIVPTNPVCGKDASKWAVSKIDSNIRKTLKASTRFCWPSPMTQFSNVTFIFLDFITPEIKQAKHGVIQEVKNIDVALKRAAKHTRSLHHAADQWGMGMNTALVESRATKNADTAKNPQIASRSQGLKVTCRHVVD